jgi:hypothetical protein
MNSYRFRASALAACISSRAVLRQSVRWLLVLLRSVPELVWALLFVRIVGLGYAGVLAIALTYCGMLGKVYAEIIEASEPQATRVLLDNGSSRLAAFFYGTLPNAASACVIHRVSLGVCDTRFGGDGLRRRGRIRSTYGRVHENAGRRRSIDDADRVRLAGWQQRMHSVSFSAKVWNDETVAYQPDRSACITASTSPYQSQYGTGVADAVLMVAASFYSLQIDWRALLSEDAIRTSAEFLRGFTPPDTGAGLLQKYFSRRWKHWQCPPSAP